MPNKPTPKAKPKARYLQKIRKEWFSQPHLDVFIKVDEYTVKCLPCSEILAKSVTLNVAARGRLVLANHAGTSKHMECLSRKKSKMSEGKRQLDCSTFGAFGLKESCALLGFNDCVDFCQCCIIDCNMVAWLGSRL